MTTTSTPIYQWNTEVKPAEPVTKEQWLNLLEVKRQAIIMELGSIEIVLIENGRLSSRSIVPNRKSKWRK